MRGRLTSKFVSLCSPRLARWSGGDERSDNHCLPLTLSAHCMACVPRINSRMHAPKIYASHAA
eukprot:8258834-Pyramimonas_sp.AAC.1